jgi:capsular exopolysaccharide synthesis family protein
VMALAVLLALGVAVVINAKTRPMYAATVTFFVTTTSADPNEAMSGATFVQMRLKTYAALLTSDRLAESLAADPRLGLTPAQVQDRITVTTEGDSVLIGVVVTDAQPSRALALSGQIVGQFEALVRSLETPPGQKVAAVQVQALEPPRLQNTPISPRPMHNGALAIAVGLILGAGLAVVREVTDGSVRSSAQLEALTAAPVLAVVPADRAARRRSGPFISDSRSPRAEALRRLRTNVQYADRENPVKTLAVTSAMPGEGRSATACGLAILFAEAGQRVLIVDAELRAPRLAAFLGREGSAGLTTVLLGAASLDQVLQPWGSGLWLLSSGHRPPNPSELLGSQRMAELLDELRGRFDMVIVDAPPLLPVADGAVLAARVDGALLLVRSGKTTAAQVTAAVRALRAVDATLVGCVVTAAGGAGPLRRLLRRDPPPAAAPTAPAPAPPAPQPRWWTTSIARVAA